MQLDSKFAAPAPDAGRSLSISDLRYHRPLTWVLDCRSVSQLCDLAIVRCDRSGHVMIVFLPLMFENSRYRSRRFRSSSASRPRN
jgi:hypothetical protein